MFCNMSLELIYEATGLMIVEVLVELPPSWHPSDCASGQKLIPVKRRKPDMVLTPESRVFGSMPFPLQYAGCGEKGLHVVLPVEEFIKTGNVSADFGRSI